MTITIAAVMLGLAVVVVSGSRSTPHVVRLRLALGTGSRPRMPKGNRSSSGQSSGGATRPSRAMSGWSAKRFLPGLAVSVTAFVGGWLVGPVGVFGAILALPLARRWRRRRARERSRRMNSAAVADACLVIGSELAAGGSAQRAMAAAAHEWPELFGSAAGRMAVGDDPVPSLRDAAQRPGAEAMTAVAGAWEVAERSGARAAVVLRVVADSIRDEAAVGQEAESQLMTVRTTARMLAALPVITLVVFSGGLEPIRFLVSSPYGLACLAGASLLIGAGLAWVGVVHRDATRSVWQR